MKKIKTLLTITYTITLATAAILGTFVDAAEAGRGDGKKPKGSQGGATPINIDYDFEIYELDDFSNIRTPNEDGTFIGALEKFNLVLNDVGNGDFIRVPNLTSTSYPNLTLNLTPRFVTGGSTISLLDGTNVKPAFASVDFDSINPFAKLNMGFAETLNNRIELTITGDELNAIGINELTFFIDDGSNTIPDILDTKEEFDNSIKNNNLVDIIEQDLFGLVNGWRITGLGFPDGVPSTDTPITMFKEGDFNVKPGGSGDLFLPPDKETEKVPESNNIVGLLTLGILGFSLSVRRKIQSI